MLKVARSIAFWLVAFALTTGNATAQEADSKGYNLKWKLDPGKKLTIAMEQDISMEMTIGGQKVNTTTKSQTWMGFDVTEVNDDGNTVVESTLQRVKMSMNAPQLGDITYDSDSGDEPTGIAAQLASAFTPMLKVPFKQVMKTSGEVVSVDIPEDALKGVKGPGAPTKEMLEQLSRNASLQFPSDYVQIGQKWTNESEMTTPVGRLKVANEYTYAGPVEVGGKKLHQVDVVVSMDFGEGENQLGAKIEVVEQNTKGQLFFDNEAGHLDHSEIDQNMTMNISVVGQKTVQKITQKSKAVFSPAKAAAETNP